jgi:hypothetical protein
MELHSDFGLMTHGGQMNFKNWDFQKLNLGKVKFNLNHLKLHLLTITMEMQISLLPMVYTDNTMAHVIM